MSPIRVFLLILRPLSSKLLLLVCHMAVLVNRTRFILFAHCAFGTDCLCLLSYPSSLLLWLLFACCGLRKEKKCYLLESKWKIKYDLLWSEKISFHRLQTGVVLRLFSLTCTKLPNPSTCPSFSNTAPAPIRTNFPILGLSSSPQNFRSPRPVD